MVFWRKKVENPKPPPRLPNLMKFVFGGLSGMGSSCVLQPLDLAKTRMQVDGRYQGKTLRFCMRDILLTEGVTALYSGLTVSIFRQATATAARFGTYSYLNQQFWEVNQNLFARIVMAAVSGAMGAFVGAPAELITTRMSADGRLPFVYRYKYTGVANALMRIIKEEGICSLWIGCVATFAKGVVLTAAQLGSYVEAKKFFTYRFNINEGFILHFYSSMVSGLICAVTSLPFDAVKTRIQIQENCGKLRFLGTADALHKIIKQEGVASLFRGFVPYYTRLGPHSVLTLVIYEQLNKLYIQHTGRGFADFMIPEKVEKPKSE